MKSSLYRVLVLLSVLSFLAASHAAASIEDDDAAVVFLRLDCTVDGSELKNCVETMAELTGSGETGWIWATRVPSAANPLLVDIGPGTFGKFWCPDTTSTVQSGYVSLRGSGRDVTTLKETSSNNAMRIKDCTRLAFSDLRIEGPQIAVWWSGGGDSTWMDVDLVSTGSAGLYRNGWYDTACDSGETSVHYFFGSRIITQETSSVPAFTRAVSAECSEIWWYGGEILMEFTEGTAGGYGLYIHGASDFRMFGSALRLIARPGVTNVAFLKAVELQANVGETSLFHMHGGVINVSALAPTATAGSVTGIHAPKRTVAHTPGTAYVLKNETGGTITRMTTSGSGKVLAPFLWESGTDVPVSGLVSQTGSDVFVETDCNESTGVCDGSGTSRPHMMIYDASCAPTPWYDIVTGACRVD